MDKLSYTKRKIELQSEWHTWRNNQTNKKIVRMIDGQAGRKIEVQIYERTDT